VKQQPPLISFRPPGVGITGNIVVRPGTTLFISIVTENERSFNKNNGLSPIRKADIGFQCHAADKKILLCAGIIVILVLFLCDRLGVTA